MLWFTFGVKFHIGIQWLLTGSWHRLQWDLCTSGKYGLHKASFGHCRFKAMGGASHDVKCVFLHGDLKKEIYMQKLEGFVSNPSLVCRCYSLFYHSRWITLYMAFPCPFAESLDPVDHFLSFDVSLTIHKNMWKMIHMNFKFLIMYIHGFDP